MPEQYLGIDIRDEFAALTLVSKTWGGVNIVRSHWFQLFPERGKVEAEDHFARELTGFLKIGKEKLKAVILSAPRQNYTVQSFDLPAPDAEALDSMIRLELGRHFAFPLDSMSVSYHAVLTENNRNHVIAAVARKESFDEYFSWLAQSGLTPSAVDMSLSSQLNLLAQNGGLGSELQAIVDISSNRVDVSLIKGETLIASRSVQNPDEDFSKIFFHQDIPESVTDRVAENFGGFLSDVLESTLFGSKSLESEESISRIHLFGGGHGLEFLVGPIQTQTGVDTIVVLPGFMKKDTPLSFIPSFQMTSLSLALRPTFLNPIELDLHPQARQKVKRNTEWKSTAVIFMLALAVLAGLLWGQTYRNDQILDSLNRQLNAIKPQAGKMQEIDQQFAALSGYTDSLNAIERQSPLKLPLLQELSRTLPRDTWATRISIKQNQVEIQGYSASASRLIPQLEGSDFLKNTRFKGSVTTQSLGKRFTIRTTMEPIK